MTTTLQIEEGKFYRTKAGEIVGPAHWEGKDRWDVGGAHIGIHYDSGAYSGADKGLDLVEEVPNPAIEDDGFVTVAADAGVKAALAGEVSKEDLAAAEAVEKRASKTLPELAAALGLKDPTKADPVDIKTVIADEAKRIVSGARRADYGKPESNFERIARFWDAYFKNTGRDITVTAADVSPLMRLVKEARICESPTHLDSHVDLVGYALTGAEVNGVTNV